MLVRIVTPYFVAGVVVGERAAPIIRYMESWSLQRIQNYVVSKGWEMQLCDV